MLFPFLVKTANKKAEKNKKGALKIPNSVSEGDRQDNPMKEGEWRAVDTLTFYGKFMISLKKTNLLSNVWGSFICFHRSCYYRMGKKKTSSLRNDKYFGRGKRFQIAYFPWEEKSGNIRRWSQKWSQATEELMSSLPMKHCVWFPWITVCLLNWSQDAPVAFLSCQMTD